MGGGGGSDEFSGGEFVGDFGGKDDQGRSGFFFVFHFIPHMRPTGHNLSEDIQIPFLGRSRKSEATPSFGGFRMPVHFLLRFSKRSLLPKAVSVIFLARAPSREAREGMKTRLPFKASDPPPGGLVRNPSPWGGGSPGPVGSDRRADQILPDPEPPWVGTGRNPSGLLKRA